MNIAEAERRTGLTRANIRFYEKEGIIHPERTKNGIRVYTEENIGQLEMALCLKSTGMPLKDIKRYFDLVEQGDETLEERLRIFEEHRAHVLEGIEELKKHLEKINYKINYLKSMEGK